MPRPKVYIAYTGGTIGMRRSEEGYIPEVHYLSEMMAQNPVFKNENMPQYTIHEYTPLLDSSNMTPSRWHIIAKDIVDHYYEYDGFVILHGTDTMAYSASALSFLLANLRKPVIFTGSQIPLCEVRNDATENLITALLIASHFPIPEVCLYFNSRLLRGCRSTKANASGFAAFESPNFPALGHAGVDITVNWDLVRHPPSNSQAVSLKPINHSSLAVIKLFPGLDSQVLGNLLLPPLKGVVVETYGMGNGPEDEDIINVFKEAHERGLILVSCSQCMRGQVSLQAYRAGQSLAKAGFISGIDMTKEAAITKLYCLLSANDNMAYVTQQMQSNWVGELTIS